MNNKAFIIFSLSLLFLFGLKAFSQDSIYGDYLLAGYDRTVSLDLEGAQLVDVLKMLSQQSGFNFVSTEAVRARTLTLYIEDVPLREAMDIIFKANNLNYDYYPDTDMFVIKEMGKPDLELMSKVYLLKYIRVESTRMQADIDAIVKKTEETGGSEEEEETGTTEEEKTGIKAAVEAVLTEYGKIVEDPITNSLTVVDVPARFPLIDQVISQLDIPLPKVMIEVEMLDVAKGVVDQLGVRWPATLVNLNVTGTRFTNFPFTNQDVTDGATQTWPAGAGSLDDIITFTDFPANKFTPSILTVIGADLALQFLRTQSDTKFLARPKILTVANETAQVEITKDQIVGSNVTTTTTSTQQALERRPTGTRLRVTPQVDQDTGLITLFVEMYVAEAIDSEFAFGEEAFIEGTLQDVEQRTATAVVRLQEGQTLFMGGLIRTNETNTEIKVPLLGDIPILGRLFRYKNKETAERELLVFITPRLMDDKSFLAMSDRSLMQREQFGSSHNQSMTLALDAFNRR